VADILSMSKRELTRAEVMQRLLDQRLKQAQAASMLAISIRHLKRLLRAYRKDGAPALISKRRGRPGNHRLPQKVITQALQLIRTRYADFGPTLAHEKLTELHHLKLSVESVRQLMIAAGLWQPRRGKAPRIHQSRERRSCLGELCQIDGSPHDWFEGRAPRCTLLVFIDDATSRLMHLRFVASETTFTYFAATAQYLRRHGKPQAFYSDKYSVFRPTKAGHAGVGH
jgi:transposase